MTAKETIERRLDDALLHRPWCYNSCMTRCPAKQTGYLSLQVNVICLLLALIGCTIIVRHPAWFGSVPTATEHATSHSG